MKKISLTVYLLAILLFVSTSYASVYDDFSGSDVDSTLWNRNDDEAVIFTQSGGLLNADGPPNLTHANIWSTYRFRGDVEFVLDFRDFQTTATVFTKNLPSISLQIFDREGDCIWIALFYTESGYTFPSSSCDAGSVLFEAPTSTTSGLLKISRTGSTITTSYNEGASWVTLGTFSGAFTGDVTVQIGTYTGDNGTFHVSSDWITYEGQILLSPVPDIRANGSDGPVTISTGDTLSLTVELDAGGNTDNSDWWVLGDTPFGWYYKDLSSGWKKGQSVTHQGSLFDLSVFEVMSMALPVGSYTFYFGVDTNMNGAIDMDQIFYDSVDVTITP